jgi:hypothetical protein
MIVIRVLGAIVLVCGIGIDEALWRNHAPRVVLCLG